MSGRHDCTCSGRLGLPQLPQGLQVCRGVTVRRQERLQPQLGDRDIDGRAERVTVVSEVRSPTELARWSGIASPT
jgi:hypothetical protein